eukprot:1161075-Pelagomonas_calceolata.AAC.2
MKAIKSLCNGFGGKSRYQGQMCNAYIVVEPFNRGSASTGRCLPPPPYPFNLCCRPSLISNLFIPSTLHHTVLTQQLAT